jgi:hypothetical protein
MVFSILLETTVPTFSFLGMATSFVLFGSGFSGFFTQNGLQLGNPMPQLTKLGGIFQLVHGVFEAGIKQ